ncbi:dimethylhistidine N-methyltransferase [Palleronia aestuarii]|uniref:Dimethylhistidine N-methyltransferase n=1 Tax=Palleronia aestuarii TaxID=568105 RepID=A0A2W7NEH6_9RHOB|nr:L-histidine N(alpha)-methyltransferase [Palleronia aestuarii]PZX16527.1 dimethylhistidine N-methyltransferase [Palleronia aestuarii]
MDRIVPDRVFTDAAREGLSASPKRMSPKWFYDAAGSALFERITELPEYYPTRTEISILRTHGEALARAVPAGAALVELGSGASIKIRLLLDALPELGAYVPVDISEDFLHASAAELALDYPALDIRPIAGDFTAPLDFPFDIAPRAKVAFFPGSTIGNLDPEGARRLMRTVRAWPGVAGFILGADLVKDETTLVAAYDDADGVTAEFNLNLLTRLNREAGANFDPERFAHRAIWNADAARIEMHLESLEDQSVQVDGLDVAFGKGETIHTESSHKYTPESLRSLAEETGWSCDELFTDAEMQFALAMLSPA